VRTKLQSIAGIALRAAAAVGVIIVGRVYNYVHRTSRRTVHRAARSEAAQQEREAATRRLKSIAHAYDAHTPLVLRLLTLEDVCTGGGRSWGWVSHPEDSYSVSCRLHLAAYYTVPINAGSVSDAILTAGDRPVSPIPFNHSGSPHTARGEAVMSAAGHTLSWDVSGTAIDEPRPMRNEVDPPVYAYLREPVNTTVSGIRQLHGTVFKLVLDPVSYFRIG